MRLQPDEAVDDVHARLFQRAGPLDVRLLVEARLQLDERHHLLARARRPAISDATIAALGAGGPVQRLLDREHAAGRGAAWSTNASTDVVERVVGVVDEHVAVCSDRGRCPAADRSACSTRLRLRRPGRVLQLGPVEPVERPQPGEVERAVDRRDVARRRARARGTAARAPRRSSSASTSSRTDVRRTRLRRREHALDRLEQVVGLVLELEVGVAGDAERVVREDLHAREQRVEVRGDDLLERDEALAVGQRRRSAGAAAGPSRARTAARRSPGRARRPRGSARGWRCTGTGAPGRPRAA